MRATKVSDTQRWILTQMQKGRYLESSYIVENGQISPNGSGTLFDPHASEYGFRSKRILPSTFATLKRLGLVEEDHRWMAGDVTQGERNWQRWNIRYQLTEKGREVIQTEQEKDHGRI